MRWPEAKRHHRTKNPSSPQSLFRHHWSRESPQKQLGKKLAFSWPSKPKQTDPPKIQIYRSAGNLKALGKAEIYKLAHKNHHFVFLIAGNVSRSRVQKRLTPQPQDLMQLFSTGDLTSFIASRFSESECKGKCGVPTFGERKKGSLKKGYFH